MIDRLLRALEDLRIPATSEEVSDAIWLAGHLPAGQTAGIGKAGPRLPPQPEERMLEAELTGARPGLPADVAGEQDGRTVTAHPRAAGILRAGRPAMAAVGMPAASALLGIREINSALRPLRRRYTSPVISTLDEAATAASIADSGLWYPRLQPAMERWLDLALIVDDSESMVVWRRTVSEFRVLLGRLGAFRLQRTWRFDGDLTAGEFPRLRGESGPHVYHHRELLRPGGRQLVLLVSDCIGAGWRSGSVARLLAELGGVAPVAVLQPLPQWLWARCGLQFTPVQFHAAEPGLASRRVIAVARDPCAARPTGTAIPVLELEQDARWLAPWASLVAQSGSVPGVALYTGHMTVPGASVTAEDSASASAADQLPATDRLLRFRAAASPAAYQLAGYLAVAPLSLPVMRLVQRVMMPRSQSAQLAEIFLGGLLRRVGSDAGDQESASYDFHDGVRELLVAGLSRADTLRVLDEASRFVSARLGSPTTFQALLAAGADKIADLDPPFAQVAYTALRALGGHYADVAAKLEPYLDMDSTLVSRPGTAEAGSSVSLRALESGAELRNSEDGGRRSRASPVGGPSHTPGDDVTYPTPGPRTGREHDQQPRVFHGVPRRNPYFTGRDDLLHELRSDLSGNVTALLPQALHGLGGVGKTQLAVEFARRFATDYELVWW